MDSTEELWSLFRKRYPAVYSFEAVDGPFLRKETDVLRISNKKGDVKAYGAHSARSAWIHKPWKEGKNHYLGYEYKGIGEDGKKIRRFAKTAWGGIYRREALAEHRFSKTAFDAGVFCQRPIAIYSYGKLYGKPLAVLVRSFVSPLRLSDFMFEKRFYNRYLNLRNETSEEYCKRISSTLGKNVRKLFDIGLYHGSMETNNITTEGELADFEPTYGGTWEGLRRTKDPYFRYLALVRVLDAGKKTFPDHHEIFSETFGAAFFGKKTRISDAKAIAERYCGTKIRERKPKKSRVLEKAIRIIQKMKENTKNRKRLMMLDFVIRSLES